MSSGPFAAFSERGAALAGADATEALASFLLEHRRGDRFKPERLAAELNLEGEDLDDLLELGVDPSVGLLEAVEEVRCSCGIWQDFERVAAELDEDGSTACEGCDRALDEPEELQRRTRFQLTESADHEAAVRQAISNGKPRLRCVILCALIEELEQIQAQMAQHSDIGEEVIGGGEIFLTSEFEGQHVKWDIRAAYTDQTNSSAAAVAATAALAYKPDVALFVGIAGGFPKKVVRGDVVAATIVHEYEVGKEGPDGYISRALQHRAGFPVGKRAGHVRLENQWQQRIIPAVEKLASKRTPDAHTDPIAAGSKVVANPESPTTKEIERAADRAIAVEMEGAGFLVAIERFPKSSGLVIRGISDLMTGKKQSDRQGWQRQASANAAAFAFELLDRFVPEPE